MRLDGCEHLLHDPKDRPDNDVLPSCDGVFLSALECIYYQSVHYRLEIELFGRLTLFILLRF